MGRRVLEEKRVKSSFSGPVVQLLLGAPWVLADMQCDHSGASNRLTLLSLASQYRPDIHRTNLACGCGELVAELLVASAETPGRWCGRP